MFQGNIFCLVLGSMLLSVVAARSIDEILADARETNDDTFVYDGSAENKNVRRELDIIFTSEQWAAILSANATEAKEDKRVRRKALRIAKQWPGGVIPFETPDSRVFSFADRAEISKAMGEWQNYTCIKFREATSRDRYRMYFISGDGCYSYIGVVKQRQEISLARGCRLRRVIVHELGHAVGYIHEQGRPDRDEYVTIVYKNIEKGQEDQFQKYPLAYISTFGIPYDYRSIMHYGSRDFSKNGDYTILTKDPNFQKVIGNSQGLSFRDIKETNLFYECSKAAGCDPNIKCPGEGFVDKTCRCMCPGNPVRLCS